MRVLPARWAERIFGNSDETPQASDECVKLGAESRPLCVP
jgi:hypothetical protein